MIPFEAASHGTAVIATKGGGLGDIFPEDALFLTLQDNIKDSETIWALLTDEELARNQLRLWSDRSKKYTWSDTADGFVELFERSLSRPGRVEVAWTHLNTTYPSTSAWLIQLRGKLKHWGNLFIHWANYLKHLYTWLRLWAIRKLLQSLGKNTIRKKVASRVYRFMKGV